MSQTISSAKVHIFLHICKFFRTFALDLLTTLLFYTSFMNYSTISLDEWKQVGEGGNGTTYICEKEPGIILKVSHREDGTLEAVSKEFYTTQAVYQLGIPTPKVHEIVRVGDEYGTKSELIGKKQSVGRFCGEHPDQIERIAKRMAELGKQIHQTSVQNDEYIPSMKALMLKALEQTQMLSGKKLKEVTAFVESLDDASTLLHGDFSLGNLIFEIQEDGNDGKPYWIDLGRAVHGIPMFDLGHLYLFCNIFSKKERVQQIAHMTEKQLVDFWNAFALAYNGPDGMDAFTAECKRFAALDVILLGHIQTLTWSERFFLGMLAKHLFKVD